MDRMTTQVADRLACLLLSSTFGFLMDIPPSTAEVLLTWVISQWWCPGREQRHVRCERKVCSSRDLAASPEQEKKGPMGG